MIEVAAEAVSVEPAWWVETIRWANALLGWFALTWLGAFMHLTWQHVDSLGRWGGLVLMGYLLQHSIGYSISLSLNGPFNPASLLGLGTTLAFLAMLFVLTKRGTKASRFRQIVAQIAALEACPNADCMRLRGELLELAGVISAHTHARHQEGRP